MTTATDQDVQVEIRSDGNPFNTQVLVDGKPLANVLAVHWDISPGESKMVVDLDWISVHYEGQATTRLKPVTLTDVFRFWWTGLRHRPRLRRRAKQ